MQITMLKSKIHRATVTEANIHYEGSLTLDSDLMEQAEMVEYEKVQVLNINNGARFETYLIKGPPGSGVVCLNGAAARLGSVTDKVIIITYCNLSPEETSSHKPKVLLLGENNKVKSNS